MSSNPEEPIIEEMPHVTSTLIGAASAGFAIATIGILTAYATLDPGKLDTYLQQSASMFAVALPFFFAAGVFAVWLRIGTAAYFLLGLGTIAWGYGLFNMVLHFSRVSAVALLCSFSVCLLLMLVGLRRNERVARLEAQRRATQHQQSEAK
jgi:hypothetical protein